MKLLLRDTYPCHGTKPGYFKKSPISARYGDLAGIVDQSEVTAADFAPDGMNPVTLRSLVWISEPSYCQKYSFDCLDGALWPKSGRIP